MCHRQLVERFLINESAEHKLKLADDRRRLECVAGFGIASDVGENNPLARREDGFEKQITVALGRGNVAGSSLERPQIKRIAILALRKRAFVQTDREYHFEWNRPQRGKRSNRNAAPRISSAARVQIRHTCCEHLARRLVRHRANVQFRAADGLDRLEKTVPDLFINRALRTYV